MSHIHCCDEVDADSVERAAMLRLLGELEVGFANNPKHHEAVIARVREDPPCSVHSGHRHSLNAVGEAICWVRETNSPCDTPCVAAQGAAAPPSDWHNDGDKCEGVHCGNPEHGWSEDDTERLQEAGSPGSVTRDMLAFDYGGAAMTEPRHAEVGGHQDHPWVARDGGPWSPRRRNDLCVKCGGTPDCHPSAPPTTITGPAICADAVKRAYAQGQADAHSDCAFLCHHTGESFVPDRAALAENDCRHDTILRMDLPDGLQDWQCLCGMFFEPAQNTSHLRTRECSSRAAQGAAAPPDKRLAQSPRISPESRQAAEAQAEVLYELTVHALDRHKSSGCASKREFGSPDCQCYASVATAQ